MRLTFLGVGSAFTKEYYQSNMLLEVGGKKLLIDCGGTAHLALKELGESNSKENRMRRLILNLLLQSPPAENPDLFSDEDKKLISELIEETALKSGRTSLSVKDIDALYVSHPHADHIGGIEEFALMSFFNPKKQEIWTDDPDERGRPTLYINERFSAELWDDSLRGGLSTLQDVTASLDVYFNVVRVPDTDAHFEFAGIEMQMVQVVHVMGGLRLMPSYGLIWRTSGGQRIFLTTDAQHCPAQINTFYNNCDIIFQDCETTPFKSGVHAHYEELKTLPPEIKSKMFLYHYADGPLPNAQADGFAGFVTQGQVFDLH